MVLKATPGIGDQRRVFLKALRKLLQAARVCQGRDSFQDPGWGVRLNLLRFGRCRLSYLVGSCHVQGHQDKQMVSFGNLLIISRPRPPKWPTGYHAGIVSDPRPPKNSPNAFSTISLGVVCFRNDPPFEMAFHSEWLRNNPKGPHGPIPGALGSLWVPLGSLGSPWVPLGPLGSLGSAPCRSEKRA